MKRFRESASVKDALVKSALALVTSAALLLTAGCGLTTTDEKTITAALEEQTRQEAALSGYGKQLASEASESSAASSSSSSESSSSASEAPSVKPAPAPKQTIKGSVLTDAQFKQTAQTAKEDPQNTHPADASMGGGGTITIPDPPPAPETSSSGGGSESSVDSASPDGSVSDSSPSSDPGVLAPPPGGTGWVTYNGKQYCYLNGSLLKGWQNINLVGYYFDSTGALSSKMGIDVSSHQGTIDWARVRAAGIQFAMIRVGYRGYGTDPGSGQIALDPNFVANINGAYANGIQVGVYFFSQAASAAEAQAEADVTINAISSYRDKITLPVVIDSEWGNNSHTGRADRLNITDRTTCVLTFTNAVAAAGYTPMIYASQSWFRDNLDLSRLGGIQKWVARWAPSITDDPPVTIWQCCSDGTVDGISGDVDRDVWRF